MNRKLLNKLVFSGMKKNQKTLVPYLVAGIINVMIFYILYSLAFCPFIYFDHHEAFYGAKQIAIFLELGGNVVGLFSVIFLLYANNFVMKGKRREIGLYGILGLSKKNVAAILSTETLVNAIICIASGILLGTVLNKLMLLVLYKILGQAPVNGFFFSNRAFLATLILFGVIFAINLIYNVSSVSLGNPIELLKSDKTGEKEPKVKWLCVVVGIVTLVAGYALAVSTKTTMGAISNLFNAIILVIIGTYCLFTAGSIFLLKLLKNKKDYYYKTKHFISVSNLMYRMKHNAAGLASICVLSTGVILLMSCASTLMALGEYNINSLFPKDVKIVGVNVDCDEIYNKMIASSNANGISVSKPEVFNYQSTTVYMKENSIERIGEDNIKTYDDMAQVYFFTQEEYKKHCDSDVVLKENEILYYNTNGSKSANLIISGKEFKVQDILDIKAVDTVTDTTMSLFAAGFIVFDSKTTMLEAYNNVCLTGLENLTNRCFAGFNIANDLSSEQISELRQVFAEYGDNLEIGFKQEDRVFFFNTYGGVFFVGCFLAVLFLMATVMIIYYKQMSEGMEDQKRFQILMNVGLTKKEVQKTIKNQVMLVFFLPVVTAIIHMIFASNIIRVFLGMILLVDQLTFSLAIAVVSIIFVVIYAIVYKITSIEYYKIVNAN